MLTAETVATVLDEARASREELVALDELTGLTSAPVLPPRCWAMVRMMPWVIGEMLTRGRRLIPTGLPADAVVHHVGFDVERDCFVLVMESASFTPVPEGERLPDCDVVFRVEYDH